MSEKHILIVLTVVIFGVALIRPQTAYYLRLLLEGGENGSSVTVANVIALQSQLARENLLHAQLASSTGKGITVEVYSDYPFGLKDELIINAGENEGIQVGQPALFHGVFIGQVTRVLKETAVIGTLFDVRAKYAVRVGAKGVDALLVGGNEPKLTLINNDAALNLGEVIYIATPALPYGLGAGTIETPYTGQGNLFKEAYVKLPYSPGEIRTLEVLTAWSPSLP